MIHIRRAQLSDNQSVAKLTSQLGYKTSVAQIQPRLNAILTSPNDILFVAENKQAVVGWISAYIAYRLSSDLFVEISGLVVEEKMRGHGIGKQLVLAAENWAKEQDIPQMRVRCNVIRIETHHFYERLDFVSAKSQKVFKKSLI